MSIDQTTTCHGRSGDEKASYTVYVLPNTKITGEQIKHGSHQAIFSFGGTGGVGALHFQCKLDNGAWASCTSSNTYSSLKTGSHSFQVKAIDSRGQADPTPAKFAFTM